jgi:3-deoxy-D-manno-octulosonate 8-phosphate phosphatase (KDO 8-P phosphatase)
MFNYPPRAVDRAKKIKLLALDVDGILSSGAIIYCDTHSESKAFNTQDGLGIKLLQQQNITVAIITGRTSEIIDRRCNELNITHIVQGQDNKLDALTSLKNTLNLAWSDIAYMGDDLPDLSAIQKAELGLSVPNAPSYIQKQANWVTQNPGGQGAVREACDLILFSQNKIKSIINQYSL